MPKQVTRTCKDEKEFESDAKFMESKGWYVVNQTSHKDQYNTKKGCCLGSIFLPLMALGRGKSSIIATYEDRNKK